MALVNTRFAGDPALEACVAGGHRMMAPENNESVRKVQQALMDLGFSVQMPHALGFAGPSRLVGGQVGDGVHGFGAPFTAVPFADLAGHLVSVDVEECPDAAR